MSGPGNLALVNSDPETRFQTNFLGILYEISRNLSLEDRTLRNFRKSIALSETLKKDFIPILINVKDLEVVDAVIRILVNLSVPVECLVPVELMSKSDAGRRTILELNSFLMSSKETFIDPRTTRVIIDYLKLLIEMEEKRKLSEKECESINNCLLLLRNVLHIPETKITSHSTIHNQIVWNLFVQNIDKVLIHLMTCEQKSYWGVTMVQLIAVMYKDQHVGTLQKLLNSWFEASLSESSDDNESNTSPPEQGSDFSPILTSSDPTSDSSDTGGGGRKSSSNQDGSSGVPHVTQRVAQPGVTDYSKLPGKKVNCNGIVGAAVVGGNDRKLNCQLQCRKSKISYSKKCGDTDSGAASLCSSEASLSSKVSNVQVQQMFSTRSKAWSNGEGQQQNRECFSPETSDCGYGTQPENLEPTSTSSNEEETPQLKRPVHQKPHNAKTRYCNKQTCAQDKKEMRRKKLVKRSKTTIVNTKAMAHHSPTGEDVTQILKEFTVDFLLKAYGSLVQVLYAQLLTPPNAMRMDTSHFFWLLTYFLKFAAQLELDLEHIRGVLSYEILSYLTYEGVNICECLEIALRRNDADVKSYLRRQHLVVTAIREFVQTVETYGKISHLGTEDKNFLRNLQRQISSTDDLKSMFVLLLRQYDPNFHNKQYLQDLIVTNHILLSFLEASSTWLRADFGPSLIDHIKQFASADVMRQYGILLEDFEINGEYINDCVFTMMHHIGGDANRVSSLFQPNILKTFTRIWERDFRICDDWSDLIEYVIHRFINLPGHYPVANPPLHADIVEYGQSGERLSWYLCGSSVDADPMAAVIRICRESPGENLKSNSSKQQIFCKDHEHLRETGEELINSTNSNGKTRTEMLKTETDNDITELTGIGVDTVQEILIKDNRGEQLSWLQRLLIEVCYVKLVKDVDYEIDYDPISKPLEPIPNYYSHLNQSIPVVSWNAEQAASLLLQPFQTLLHKLGFHLPADTGKVFARIPSFWTVEVLFSVAKKLGPIDFSDLKFEMKHINNKFVTSKKQEKYIASSVGHENRHFAFPKTKYRPCLIKHTSSADHTCRSIGVDGRVKKSSLFSIKKPEEQEEKKLGKPLMFLTPPKAKESEIADSDAASICSVCETNRESVASDLTRMCMSDEDQAASN